MVVHPLQLQEQRPQIIGAGRRHHPGQCLNRLAVAQAVSERRISRHFFRERGAVHQREIFEELRVAITELDLNPVFALPPGQGCRIAVSRA